MEESFTMIQEDILDWDDYTFSAQFNKKIFYQPLCIQSVKKTENRGYWHVGKYEKHKNYFLYKLECSFSYIFLNLLRFDRDDPLTSWEFVYQLFNITNLESMQEYITKTFFSFTHR